VVQKNTFSSPVGIAVNQSGRVVVAVSTRTAGEIAYGAPEITSLSTDRMDERGGDKVTVHGLNFAPDTASVTFKLLDTSGKEVSRTTRDIRFRGHLASFVSGPEQLFPAVSNFRGTLLVQSASALFTVALRQCDDGCPCQ